MAWKKKADKRKYEAEYIRRPDVAARRRSNFQEWRCDNREHLRQAEAKRRKEKRAQVLLATVRTRARRRGLAYDLDDHLVEIQARIDAGRCEVSGFPFSLEAGSPFNAPSIDRKDPKLGYVYDNIRVVCYAVNCALGDWGEGKFMEIVECWTAMGSLRKRPKRS